jgi:hypothetical protein
MFAANLVECFTRWAGSSTRYVVETLADAFFNIGASGKVE